MRMIILFLLPVTIMASTSLDDEIINDLDFYQNLEIVQETKNTIDLNLESMGLVTDDQISTKPIVEKEN